MTEDTQVRAIVLSVDETTNTIVCFSEPLESKINVKLPPNFIAKQGQRLTFGDHDYNNETYFPGSNPEWITIEDDPSVRFENNELLITTRAAFSFLDTHPTYSKKKVYAGGFGHVEIEDHLSEKMDRAIVYKVELSLNVLETKDNEKAVFKVTKVHELLESEDVEAFLNDLYEFDERTPAENDDEVVDNNQREIELPHVHMNENTESSARSESLTSYNRETLLTVAERSMPVEEPLEQETTKNVLIDVNNDASNENVTSTSTEETGLSSSSSMSLLNCQSIDLSAQKSDGSGETSPEIVPFQEDRFEMVQDGIREDSSVQSDSSSMDYPATEASSLGKDVRDSKPKPFSFGRMPTSFSGRAQTTSSVGVNEVQKNDIEYCVIVLDNKNGAVIGFETNLLKLMTIVMEETDLERYGTLRFISEREENGKVYPKLGTLRFTEPVDSVIVNDATSIPARVMFSPNQKHGSYNKTVAFSDSYGLVRIPESNASLKHMAVYNTFIQLCQNEDRLKPIFISVSPLKQDENEPNARFIESMYNYEDNIFTETRSRGIASTRPPQNSWKSVGIQKGQKGNFKPRRVTLPNFYKALYVSDKQHGKLFGVLYTSVGDASLRVRPSIIGTGVMLNLSEWASVKLEAIGPEGREDFFVSKCSSFVDPLGCTTKFVNGEIVVEGTLTLKPVAKYYDLLYYKHGLLGLVQGDTDLYLGYENEDVHVQFTRLEPENYRKLTIHEYKAVNKKFNKTLDEWERVCWRARRLDRSSLDSSNRSREEDLSDCNKSKDFCNNSSSIQQDLLKTPEKMKYVESRNDCQTCEHPNHTPQRQNFYDNSYEESSDNGIPYQQSYQNFSQSSSQYYSPRPTDFNHLESERQYYNHSFVPSEMDTASVTTDSNNLISSIGMIVSRHKQMMVVYLDDFRRAGILRWKHFDSSFIKLGNLFRCMCKPIEIQEETLHASYEVIKIIELVNERNETIVKDEECQVLVNVNLFKQDPVFNDFTRKSGRFVLSSGDFGNVLMEDTVVNVTGQVVPSAGVIEEYRGLPGSDTMVGYCVYKKCLIPPMLIDSSCSETAEVVAYAWRLVKLVSTLTHYSFNQQDIKIKNLGEKASTLEKEDDISRQKKQAQIQFELDNQNRQGSSSVGFHQRPQSSRYEQSSSNYENFATPQGSVYNHRMESSQSYRTANEYRLGSQRASSPSLRSEITQPGYNANMTPTFRSTPQPMQHYDLQADNEKILRLLEVLNERVSVFTRNPDTREVMHSLAPGHLAMLEEAMESSEKQLQEWRRSTHH